MKPIADFIEHLECPTITGIIFPDGTIHRLDIRMDWKSSKKYTIHVGSQTSIEGLREENELGVNYCGINVTAIDKQHDIEVVAGEGNFGSDGFIAVVGLKTRKLIWLAFFESSNPFDKINIINEEIHATSTLNCVWKFKISSPIQCTVNCNS